MKKFTSPFAMIVLSVLAFATAAYADTVGPAVLTPDGANTDFNLSGVYSMDTPLTAYSGPNLPWTLTFTLPTSPTSFAVLVPGIDIFGIDTSVTLNGVNIPNTQVVLFGISQDGGLLVCPNSDCAPDYPPAPNFFDIFTVDTFDNYTQLYSGDVTAPTLLSGTFPVDGGQSTVAIAATPEPSSLLMIGTGLLGLCIRLRNKLPRGLASTNIEAYESSEDRS